jgi:hypothetical protein
MFSKGQIVYFTPFYFKNGNTAKNKYFIILKNYNSDVIIATLPTRTNKAPALIDISHGCINDDDRCFNCYLFEGGREICVEGFYFDMNTYVYGNEVEDYKTEQLMAVYGIEGVDYNIIGHLTEKEFHQLYECIKVSKSIKNKIKRML